MTTWVAWESAAGVGADDHVLAFDAAATQEAAAMGATADLVDDHLTWAQRVSIDEQAARLTDTVADNDKIDVSVRRFAAYHLRSEFVNLLRAWTAASAWTSARPEARSHRIAFDATCPSSIVLGARAALAGTTEAPTEWIPQSHPARATGARLAAARLLLGAHRLARRARYPIRILTVPSMQVGVALSRTDPRVLRELGVGVGLLATLDHGTATRLAPPLGLPSVASAWPRRSARREAEVRRQAAAALGVLDEDTVLDAILRLQAEVTLVACESSARQVEATLERWARLPDLEAVLLPTVANGAGRLVLEWSRERGVAVGVVQHGIYGFRGADGADRGADAIFSWGPGVAEQVAEWEGNRARAVAVGAPGIHEMRPSVSARTPVRRVLIATTNNPTGSALGLSAFQDAFVHDVADGLRSMSDNGVKLDLRIHPAESADRYRRAFARLGLPVAILGSEPLDEALDRTDLLVSSVSSVAFEGAARGLPVLLWTGRVPAEVRRYQFVSPLADCWPGMFDDDASFSALVNLALEDPAGFIEEVTPLSDELRRYVSAFDAATFSAGLRSLRRS